MARICISASHTVRTHGLHIFPTDLLRDVFELVVNPRRRRDDLVLAALVDPPGMIPGVNALKGRVFTAVLRLDPFEHERTNRLSFINVEELGLGRDRDGDQHVVLIQNLFSLHG